MRILTKNLSDWHPRMRRTLRQATLSGGWLKKYMSIFPNARTITIFNERQMMGWAFCVPADNTIYLQMFVNPRYRGRHLGTKLAEEALRHFPSVTLAEWDHATKRLFRKLRDAHPGRISTYIYTWAKESRKFRRLKIAQAPALNGSMK